MTRAGAAIACAIGLAVGCGAHRGPAPPELAGFGSEAAVFADAQRRLAARGYPEAAGATLVVEPELLLGYYRDGVVHMRAVFAAPAEVATRLDRLVRGVYGDRAGVFAIAAGARADAVRAFTELGVIAIGHELFHHVRLARAGGDGPIDVFAEEDAAMQLEVAWLADLVARGVVERGWLDRYARLQRAFVAACRPELVAGLPAAPAERRARFDAIADASFAALAAIARGEPNPAPDLLQERTALYALRRLELVAAPPRPFPEVAAALLGPPEPEPVPGNRPR